MKSNNDIIATGPCGYESSGQKGWNVKWELHEDGILIVSGKGNMSFEFIARRGSDSMTHYKIYIRHAVVTKGVKSVALAAFAGCKNLEGVRLSESIEEIGCCAFSYCDRLESVNIPSKVTCLEAYTFLDCYSLKSIYLNGFVSIKDETVFENVDVANITICVPKELYDKFVGDKNWVKFNIISQ